MARRVLIVDDDTAFCDTLAASFRRRGWEALTAANLGEAEAQFGLRPDHVVIDLRLETESGLALLPRLRAALPEARVVVLTGYASIPMAVEAIKLGATNFLTKPVDTDDILAAFDHTAGESGPAEPAEPMSVRRLTWEHVQRVLNDNDGNISATARALGMHRRTLQRFLAKRPAKR